MALAVRDLDLARRSGCARPTHRAMYILSRKRLRGANHWKLRVCCGNCFEPFNPTNVANWVHFNNIVKVSFREDSATVSQAGLCKLFSLRYVSLLNLYTSSESENKSEWDPSNGILP
jgi:hypothetical protein